MAVPDVTSCVPEEYEKGPVGPAPFAEQSGPYLKSLPG